MRSIPGAGAAGAARRVLAWTAVLIFAAGFAGADDEEPDPLFDDFFEEELEAEPSGYPDPLETSNRGVLAFNRQLDRWILDPITRAYRFVFPSPVRNAISRFFLNLGSTRTLANDLLQLEWKDAGVTTARLVINTTVGIAGFFDMAEKIGLERHESDFGQTLALAGTPSGPYLMLPVLGPSTLRDGSGVAVDGFFQPTFYILGPTELLVYAGSSGLSTRDRHFLELKALEDSAIDLYAAMRSGFYQDRVGAIWGRREGHRTSEEPSTTRRREARAEKAGDAEADPESDPLFDDPLLDGED